MTKRLFDEVLKEITFEHGLAGEPDSAAVYIMSCHTRFESSEAFMERGLGLVRNWAVMFLTTATSRR